MAEAEQLESLDPHSQTGFVLGLGCSLTSVCLVFHTFIYTHALTTPQIIQIYIFNNTFQ